MRYKLWVVFLLFAFFCGQGTYAAAVNEGDEAPLFQLNDLDGHAVSLSDYPDSLVILNFWAIWCIPCRVELQELDALYRDYQARGLVVLTIIEEKVDKAQAYIDKEKLSLPVLIDPKGKVFNLFLIRGVPQTFIINRGVVIEKIIGAFSFSKEQFRSWLDKQLSGETENERLKVKQTHEDRLEMRKKMLLIFASDLDKIEKMPLQIYVTYAFFIFDKDDDGALTGQELESVKNELQMEALPERLDYDAFVMKTKDVQKDLFAAYIIGGLNDFSLMDMASIIRLEMDSYLDQFPSHIARLQKQMEEAADSEQKETWREELENAQHIFRSVLGELAFFAVDRNDDYILDLNERALFAQSFDSFPPGEEPLDKEGFMAAVKDFCAVKLAKYVRANYQYFTRQDALSE